MEATLALEVRLCNDQHWYIVRWDGDENAVDQRAVSFVRARLSTCVFNEVEGEEVSWARFPLLWEVMNPLCEHQLPADRCYGPDHYPNSDQEMAFELEG